MPQNTHQNRSVISINDDRAARVSRAHVGTEGTVGAQVGVLDEGGV